MTEPRVPAAPGDGVRPVPTGRSSTMSTTVGLCTIEFLIPGVHSLKEKRSVVKSMLDGMRSRFNVSAAEVANNDLWQRATIAVCCVSNSQPVVDSSLNKIADWVEANPRISITDVQIEFL